MKLAMFMMWLSYALTFNAQIAMADDGPDTLLLARTVFAEAAGEPVRGKFCVATVIVNRINHPGYPDTLERVVYQRNAFSSVTSSSPLWRLSARPEQMNEQEQEAWHYCLVAARFALKGYLIDDRMVAFRHYRCKGGAAYFNTLTPIEQAGRHVFYVEKE